MPGVACIGGLIQPAPRAIVRTTRSPWRPTRSPHIGVQDLRVGGIEGQINRSRVFAFVENFLPSQSTIERAEYAFLGIRTVVMSEHSNKHTVRIVRIDQNYADLLSVAQAEMLPCTAAVGGLINSVTG